MSRRKTISLLLWIWLLATPFIAAYVVSASSGISRDVAYAIPSSDPVAMSKMRVTNGTSVEITLTDYTYDNVTGEIDSLMTYSGVIPNAYPTHLNYAFNITDVDSDVYRIVLNYSYSGAGNITSVGFGVYSDLPAFYSSDSSDNVVLYSSSDDPGENATITVDLEAFQSIVVGNKTYFYLNIQFGDSTYKAALNDVFSFVVMFYKKDTLISRASLIQYVVGGFAVLNFIFAIAMTPLWNPLLPPRPTNKIQYNNYRGSGYRYDTYVKLSNTRHFKRLRKARKRRRR